MPNWKKVIVSGSDAVLNSVTATAGLTGSLSGSATSAISSSYALTASFALNGGGGAAFPFTGDAQINGSLSVTGSFNQASASLASGLFAHAQGIDVYATGDYSHAEGNNSSAIGLGSHAEGFYANAVGNYSHAEGRATANGDYSHAEGETSIANGDSSHAEGYGTVTSGSHSHAEGSNTVTSGSYSHAEGYYTTAIGPGSHAEGYYTTAFGTGSHAEGFGTNANGNYSHAEGEAATANGQGSHAEAGGTTTISGSYAHAEGVGTVANGFYQHVQGRYNISSSAESAFIVGNGTGTGALRSNLIFASGSLVQITGSLIVAQNKKTGSLNTSDRTLQDDRNRTTIDWNNAVLYDQNQPTSIQSVGWSNRTLYSSTGINSVRWDYRDLKDSTDYTSVDWENRTLTDTTGNPTLNWNVGDNGYAMSSSYYYKSKIDLGVQQNFVDTPILSNTANYAGEVIIGAVDETVTLYDLVYLKHDGVWYPADQNNSLNKLLGICLEVPPVEDPQPIPYVPGPGSILLEGTITVLSGSAYHNESPIINNLDHGLPIYPTSGVGKFMTTTSPTGSGDYVRVLGHAYQQSSTYADYWIMKFRPSNDWITI
jgi:hypothetical protein